MAAFIFNLTMYQMHHSGASIDRARRFRTLQVLERRGQWRAFSSITRYDMSSRLAADCRLLTAPNQDGNTRATRRGAIDITILSLAVRKRMTGKYFIDVFGGSGFLSKATNHLGLRGCALDRKFGPRCDVTQPEFDRTSLLENVSQQ